MEEVALPVEGDKGCKIPPPPVGGKLGEKEEAPWVLAWGRLLPPEAAAVVMEGCNSPLGGGEIEGREEAGLGCRPAKEEPPWAEVPAAGVGCRRLALPPPGMAADWSKLAAEVGGAEKEERVLEAASKGHGVKKKQKEKRQCESMLWQGCLL